MSNKTKKNVEAKEVKETKKVQEFKETPEVTETKEVQEVKETEEVTEVQEAQETAEVPEVVETPAEVVVESDKEDDEAPAQTGVAKLSIQERAKVSEIAQAEAAAAAERDKRSKARKLAEAAERRNIDRMRKSKLGTERVIGTNPIALPWPQDESGALSKLKQGGIIAARRVHGDKAKLVRMLKTLDILGKHAKARFVMDTKQRKKARENHLSARVRNEEARRKSAEAKAVELEAAAARTRKNAGIVATDKE